MAEAVVRDWQSNKSLAETNKYMWINKIGCDVTFLVGAEKEKVQAHKYILTSRSSVFYTMFEGSIPADPNKPIHVPDIEPDIFEQLCLYMYTETIQVTTENVLALLHAAKIYMVQALIDKCLHRLKCKMQAHNLCMIMEAAHVFGEDELWEMCQNGILRDPRHVLPSETLVELCSDCLESIIKNDDLRLEEEELFECLLGYSVGKCQKEGLAVTPENQRKVLGKVLYQIRFTLMDDEYFTDKVQQTGLLTHEETGAVIRYFLNPQTANEPPFNTNPRSLHQIVKRFQSQNAGWVYNYRNNADAITFECDTDIQIYGVLQYGSSDGPKEFDAKITILETETKAAKVMQVFKIKSDGKMKYYDCLFNNPIQIRGGKRFTITLEMKPGKTTFFGEDGLDQVEKGGITFKFMNSTLSLNNTTHTRGQIPGIIYCIGT